MKHGWNSLSHYLDIHEKILGGFSRFMVTPQVYDPPTWLTPYWLQLICRKIQLQCMSGDVVHVKIEKDVEVDRTYPKRLRARTWGYSYQANRPSGAQLIRYCSPDLNSVAVGSHQGTGHHAVHHLHDYTSGKEVISPIGDDEWPHVGEFLTEIRRRF